jgi:hypothetical protein
MNKIIREVRWAFQRMFRGYDDTFMWDMEGYFSYTFVPAIKKFCQNKLEYCIDEKFISRYKEMLVKIEAYEKSQLLENYGSDEPEDEMWSYFGQNIGFFWD